MAASAFPVTASTSQGHRTSLASSRSACTRLPRTVLNISDQPKEYAQRATDVAWLSKPSGTFAAPLAQCVPGAGGRRVNGSDSRAQRGRSTTTMRRDRSDGGAQGGCGVRGRAACATMPMCPLLVTQQHSASAARRSQRLSLGATRTDGALSRLRFSQHAASWLPLIVQRVNGAVSSRVESEMQQARVLATSLYRNVRRASLTFAAVHYLLIAANSRQCRQADISGHSPPRRR